MLIDRGNLVYNLVLEEFAKLAQIQYQHLQRKVGTAAKGRSVSIVRKCPPVKIFLEDIPQPITIELFVVRDLSHPLNVGRNFLGRYQGKLEFS